MPKPPLKIRLTRSAITAAQCHPSGYKQIVLGMLKENGAPVDGGFILKIRPGIRWTLEVDPETQDLLFEFEVP